MDVSVYNINNFKDTDMAHGIKILHIDLYFIHPSSCYLQYHDSVYKIYFSNKQKAK